MGVRDGYSVVSAVVPDELHQQIRELAEGRGVSVSVYLAEALAGGSKRYSVRSNGRELFVALPKKFVGAAGLSKGGRVRVSYDSSRMIIDAK